AAPANAHPSLLAAIAPHVEDGVTVGTLFGQGGFDWAATHAFGKNFKKVKVLFGLLNIPWICKTTKYGHSSRIIGPKKQLYAATYPVELVHQVADKITALFDIECLTLPNFLNLTLTPSNQIIHPARYFGIFRDWDGQRTYTRQELKARNGDTLYDNFDAISSETLATLDNELQQVRAALVKRVPQLDLSYVLPITERIVLQYGEQVKDKSSLQTIFCSNLGYRGCATPVDEISTGQVQPAVNSRLFWEDIPYGLCILKGMAEILGNFPTPAINSMIRWHQQYMGIEFLSHDDQLNPLAIPITGSPYKYGIHTIQDLVLTSLPQGSHDYKHPTANL
ncbi:unnamed protein product, partial [Chrysoparadoxa australica]